VEAAAASRRFTKEQAISDLLREQAKLCSDCTGA
jgi:hypothetical protein